jgi:RNA polymerase sigma-70 factor, ECF subfamily
LDEPELIRRARQGDGAAWEALVLAHQEGAFRFAYLFLGDAGQAEDVAQEAFIRAFRSLERFDSNRSFRPWLLSITANLAKNQRRSIYRYLSAIGRLGRETSGSEDGLERGILNRLDSQTLWQAVRQLDPNDQQIIYLRYFLDLSVAETSESLGVAEGTVKSRLHRALGRLRSTIERNFPGLQEQFEME